MTCYGLNCSTHCRLHVRRRTTPRKKQKHDRVCRLGEEEVESMRDRENGGERQATRLSLQLSRSQTAQFGVSWTKLTQLKSCWLTALKYQEIGGSHLASLNQEALEKIGIGTRSVRQQVMAAPAKPGTSTQQEAGTDIKPPPKIVKDPIHGLIQVHPLCVKIIDTPQFQRLRHIMQLGGCYFVYPGASHNRFEHSIGVSHLAQQLVTMLQQKQPELDITEPDVLCVTIAGLCHDLGHGPFSHLFDKFTIPEAHQKAQEAQEEARKAQEEAQTAQEEAQTAQKEAQTAQEEAQTAQEEAQTAQEEAREVQEEASKYHQKAQKAQKEVRKYRTKAQEAQEEVRKYRTKAQDAQDEAQKYHEKAQEAEKEAEKEAQEAEKEAQEAEKEAQEAEKEAQEAEKEAQEAEKEALKYDQKAQEAEKEAQEAQEAGKVALEQKALEAKEEARKYHGKAQEAKEEALKYRKKAQEAQEEVKVAKEETPKYRQKADEAKAEALKYSQMAKEAEEKAPKYCQMAKEAEGKAPKYSQMAKEAEEEARKYRQKAQEAYETPEAQEAQKAQKKALHAQEKALHAQEKAREAQEKAQKALQNPPETPGNWKHEDGSVMMFDYMMKKNDLFKYFEDYALYETDLTFIQELIRGQPLEKGQSYQGRKEPKHFLYDIVANKQTGIDVDKWDYFARDCHMLGIRSNFDHDRLMKLMRVIEVGGVRQICIRDKEAVNVYNMFHLRNDLHMRVYQHKVTHGAEALLNDILLKADKHIKIKGKDGVRRSITECIDDPVAFTLLDDRVLSQIEVSERQELEESRQLLHRLRTRQLYKCAGESGPTTADVPKPEAIKDGILKILSSQEGAPELKKEDLVVRMVYFDYGMKGKNPVENLLFYKKSARNKAEPMEKEEVSLMLPTIFAEKKVRIFCKTDDEETVKAVKVAFEQWCEPLKKRKTQETPASRTPLDAGPQQKRKRAN